MRSKWKGKFITNNLYKDYFLKNKKNIILKKRSSSISEYFINQSFFIHNGIDYLKLKITKNYINFKFGEFYLTKNFSKHISKKKKKK